MKRIGKIITATIVLLIVLVILVVTNLDRGIKTAVEFIGSQLTQSTVSLDKVDLSLTTAKGSLSGLRVGNPQGFETRGFRMGGFAMQFWVARGWSWHCRIYILPK